MNSKQTRAKMMLDLVLWERLSQHVDETAHFIRQRDLSMVAVSAVQASSIVEQLKAKRAARIRSAEAKFNQISVK